MVPHNVFRVISLLLVCTVIVACEEKAPTVGGDVSFVPLDASIELDGGHLDSAIPDSSLVDGMFESQQPHVRFKGAYRLKGDIARTLDIPADEVCKELGLFDCISFVHPISLGGVEAYVSNLYEPPEQTSISAPMVVERVALSSCGYRFQRDREVDQPHLFLPLALIDGAQRVADIESSEAMGAIERMYRVILKRDPTSEESSSLKALYRSIEAHDDAVEPYREWSVLACFSLMTSVEFLFY
ncbi:MAG: hypothetical protein ACPGQS_08590 [Bradymonadia bacterium]